MSEQRMRIKRHMIADYLNVTPQEETPKYEVMSVYNQIDENPQPQTSTTQYTVDAASTSSIDSYQPQFPFDSDLMKNEKTVEFLYDIAWYEKTGLDAETDYIRVDLWKPIEGKENTYKARKFRTACEITGASADAGKMKVAGNLNGVGDPIFGEFNVKTLLFMPQSDESLGELTVTSIEGTNSGDTKITVVPVFSDGHSYRYKTGVAPTMPVYNQDCSTSTWTTWDGTADITAANGQKIIIAEVDADFKCKAAGQADIVSKA